MAFTRSIVKNTTENMNNKCETGDFWIKCGYEALVPETETTPEQQVIVSFPFDIDIEKMPELTVTASEGWVNQLNCARNKLRMDILELASELQPGETRELNLKVFIFRKTGKDKLSMNKDNPFARKDSLVK